MSAADRSGGPLVAAVIGTLMGCSASHGPDCSDAVAVGEYTLVILPVVDGPHFGNRFELTADGMFAGHLGAQWRGAPGRCDDALTPEESERLTDAINAGQFFCRGNTFFDTWYDRPYQDFELRTIDGLRDNRFCGHDVPEDTALSALAIAVTDVLLRVRDGGGCTGEPYDVPLRTDECSLSPRPPPRPPP